MTLDPGQIASEVGSAWRTSPLSFIFGAVMLIVVISVSYMTLQVFNFSTELTADADRRATETRAELVKQGEQTFQLLDEFRERQKIFRDEIWETQQQNELDTQKRIAEFQHGFDEQFKVLNHRLDQILGVVSEQSVAPTQPTR